MTPPKGLLAIHRKTLNIFFTETIRPRALILDMQNRLMVFFQVCSNNDPGLKMAPPWGLSFFHRKFFKDHLLWNYQTDGLDIWHVHVTSTFGPLPSLIKFWPLLPNSPACWPKNKLSNHRLDTQNHVQSIQSIISYAGREVFVLWMLDDFQTHVYRQKHVRRVYEHVLPKTLYIDNFFAFLKDDFCSRL